VIGILSDSHGDLAAFDAAYELLRAKGARRFFFLGARYTDLDEWILQKREKSRGGREYSDMDFLADVTSWLASSESKVPRAPAQGAAPADLEREDDRRNLVERFVRVPERESLQYRDPNLAKKAVDMVGDTLCTLVHDKNDLTRDDLLNAQVFIHGKDSEPKVVQIGPRFFVTPGRLAGAAEQTCALLEKADKNLRFSAFRLDGHPVLEPRELLIHRGGKLSVK
jgi:predicted phosphodiesterase